MPDADDSRVSPAYSGERGAEYFAWQSHGAHAATPLLRRLYAEWTDGADSVLDFGCGGGALLASIEAPVRIGVEPNDTARAAAAAAGLDVRASLDEVTDGSVAVALSNHALEHVRQPFAELAGLHRVLRPGGRLVLVVPLDDWRSQRDPTPDGNNHLYAWTPRVLANLVRDAGFEVLECRVHRYAWPPGYRLLARLPTRAFDALAAAAAVLLRRRQIVLVARR